MKKLLFLLSFLVASTSYAQEVIGDSLFIRDVAPGKVSSVLKSAGNGIKKVRITGTINDKDLSALSTMCQPEVLDFSDCTYSNKDFEFDKFVNAKKTPIYIVCKLPMFPNLKKLSLFKTGVSGKFDVPLIKVKYDGTLNYVETYANINVDAEVEEALLKPCEVEYDRMLRAYISYKKLWDSSSTIYFGSVSSAKILHINKRPQDDLCYYNPRTPILVIGNRVVLQDYKSFPIVDEWLERVTEIDGGVSFSDYSKTSISLSNLKYLSACDQLFYDCRIKTLNLPSIVSFDASALYGSRIKEVSLPASLRELTISQDNYVENVDTIRLLGSTPPQLTYPVNPSKKQKVVFVVPDGAKKKYKNAPSWKGVIVQEVNGGGATIDPSKSYNIKVEKPGTILSYLPVDKLDEIEAITITGILYETDLKVLSDCKNLISVDLSNTYICFSPEALKEKKANAEMFAGFARAMGAIADMKYDDFNMTTPDYVYAKLFTKLVEEGANTKEPEVKCIMPKGAFRNCLSLESIKFPTRCSVIEDKVCYGCSELKEVVLPPYLQEINTGAFAYCRSLKGIKIPKTLTYIGWRTSYNDPCAFGNSGIEVLDLSECSFKNGEWNCDLIGCKELKEVHFPKNITFVDDLSTNKGAHYYFSDTEVSFHHSFSFFNISLHFRHSTPPSLNSVSETTFYIPKGATTAYYAKFGKNNKYIEE